MWWLVRPNSEETSHTVHQASQIMSSSDSSFPAERLDQIDIFLSQCNGDTSEPPEDRSMPLPPEGDSLADSSNPDDVSPIPFEDDISMPTGNMSGFSPHQDESDECSSLRTVVPEDAFDEPDLIDLGPFIIPTDVMIILEQKVKIDREMERVGSGLSVSDRLTGDSSRSGCSENEASDEFKESPPLLSFAQRPKAISLSPEQKAHQAHLHLNSHQPGQQHGPDHNQTITSSPEDSTNFNWDRPALLSFGDRPRAISSAPAQSTRQVSGSSRRTVFSFSPARNGRQVSGSSGITASGTPRSAPPTRNTSGPLVYYIEEDENEDESGDIDTPESVPAVVFILPEGAANVTVTPSVPVVEREIAWNLQSLEQRRQRRFVLIGSAIGCVVVVALVVVLVELFGQGSSVSISNQNTSGLFPPFDDSQRGAPDNSPPSLSPTPARDGDIDDPLFTLPTPVAPSAALPPIPIFINPREDLPTDIPDLPRPTRPPRARRTRSPTASPVPPPSDDPSSEPSSFTIDEKEDPGTPNQQPTRPPRPPRPSQAPSPTSGSKEPQRVIDIVVSVSPQSLVALLDESTLEFKALEWVSADPSFSTYSDAKILQRWVLALFFYKTKGETWKSSTNWMDYDVDECDWYTTSTDAAICSSSGSLVTLHLEENNLNGVIPPELSSLSSSLVRLFLRDNSIVGTLPPDFGLLTQLGKRMMIIILITLFLFFSFPPTLMLCCLI